MSDATPSSPGSVSQYLLVAQGGLWPEPTMVQTILGSCVAVTIHAPKYQIGGTFHALLPYWQEYAAVLDPVQAFRYVDSGVERLYEKLLLRGVRHTEMVCKVFGGAQALFWGEQSVGRRNVLAAYETLARLGLRAASASVGGERGRKLVFASHTGAVYIKLLRQTPHTGTRAGSDPLPG